MNEALEAILYLFLPFLAIICCCCPLRKRGVPLDEQSTCDDGWNPPLCWMLLVTRCGTRLPPTPVLVVVERTHVTEQLQSPAHWRSPSEDVELPNTSVVEVEVDPEEGMQTVPREAEWDNRV